MGDTSPFFNSRTVSGLRTRGTQAPLQHLLSGVMLGRNGFSAVAPHTLLDLSILCTVFLARVPGTDRETEWRSASELLLFEDFAIFKVIVNKPIKVSHAFLIVVVVCTRLDLQSR